MYIIPFDIVTQFFDNLAIITINVLLFYKWQEGQIRTILLQITYIMTTHE